MSGTNTLDRLPNTSPILRQPKTEINQANAQNSSKSALSFFQANTHNNDEKIYPTRGAFFSAFINHTLAKQFEDVWQREETQKLIKDCGLNIQSSIDFSNTYQGSTAQDFAIYLFDILGLKDLPKNVTLNDARTALQDALENGITKEQANSFMLENNSSNVDRRWNLLMRAIIYPFVSGPQNPGWTVQEIINDHPRPKHANKPFWSENGETSGNAAPATNADAAPTLRMK